MGCSGVDSIIAVVVLYEIELVDSQTVITLQKSAENLNETIDVLVYDNSKFDRSSKYQANFANLNIHVVHDDRNMGVSFAYNECARTYAHKEWMILFDQDTTIPRDALSKYLNSLFEVNTTIAIITPVLKGRDKKILSPCNYLLHRGFHISKGTALEGSVATRGMSILNSGVMVKLSLLDQIGGFNNSLFYFSDHEFFERYKKLYSEFYIVPCVFEHEVSSHCLEEGDDPLVRFSKVVNGARTYAKVIGSQWPMFWMFVQATKLTLIFKNTEYLKIVFKRV